ncbi:MAG: adenylate/guanylate cyclase domain-containing protein [Pseudomonadota bacterium]
MPPTRPYAGTTENDWVRLARGCLSANQFFRAYDIAKEALAAFPESLHLKLMAAHALFRCGALQEAGRMLRELEPTFESRENRILRTTQLLHTIAQHPEPKDMSAVEELAAALSTLAQPSPLEKLTPELVLLMSETYRERWKRLGDRSALKRARDLQRMHYLAHRDLATGTQVVVLSWCLGDRDEALQLAAHIVQSTPDGPVDEDPIGAFHFHLWQGQLALVCGALPAAEAHLVAAAEASRRRYPLRVEARRELRLLEAHGVAAAGPLIEQFPPPCVVIFTGQQIDSATAPSPWFPEAMEGAVRDAIQRQLDDLSAEIGYCSASAGADILFMESMLERGADVHVVIPYMLQDFIHHRVAPAGYRWEFRLQNALKAAASVVQVSEDRYLGNDLILRFGNQVIDGTARLQAALLGTAPYLVSVWDYSAPAGPGTAADFIDCWGDPMRLCIIDLDGLRQSQGVDGPPPEALTAAPSASEAPAAPPQQICTMLFADVVGFSTIADQYLPGFWQFIDAVRRHIDGRHATPLLVESWGDALYVAMDSASAMSEYAHLLTTAFNEIDSRQYGLPVKLALRIGLHAGPVFRGRHPLTGHPIIYGGNVNRAARIEPISVAGHIYASQQFVALLTAEQSAFEAEAAFNESIYRSPYVCEYMGMLSLAKAHGEQAIYQLRKAPPPMEAPETQTPPS